MPVVNSHSVLMSWCPSEALTLGGLLSTAQFSLSLGDTGDFVT